MSTLAPIAERPEFPPNFSRPLSSEGSSNVTPQIRSIEAFYPRDEPEHHDECDETNDDDDVARPPIRDTVIRDEQAASQTTLSPQRSATFASVPTLGDQNDITTQRDHAFSSASNSTSRPPSIAHTCSTTTTSSTSRSSTSPTSSFTTHATRPNIPPRRSSQPPATSPLRGILKPTWIPQLADPCTEDTASHHTVSAQGDYDVSATSSLSSDSTGQWRSSDWDTSTLSEEKRRRLERKGIDPALYLEMKAARHGRTAGNEGHGTGRTTVTSSGTDTDSSRAGSTAADSEHKKKRTFMKKLMPGALVGNSYVS